MKVLIFDSETTGLPQWSSPSDHPDQPHVLDLAADLWDTDTGEKIGSLDCLIDNGIDVPADMTAIHGITRDMCEAEGISPLAAHEQFTDLVRQADMLGGHNVSFDIRMMRIHAARVTGEKWDNLLPTFCTMRKSTNICRILKEKPRFSEDWKWPTLTEAMRHFFDEDHGDAHRARPDTDAASRIFFHLRSL